MNGSRFLLGSLLLATALVAVSRARDENDYEDSADYDAGESRVSGPFEESAGDDADERQDYEGESRSSGLPAENRDETGDGTEGESRSGGLLSDLERIHLKHVVEGKANNHHWFFQPKTQTKLDSERPKDWFHGGPKPNVEECSWKRDEADDCCERSVETRVTMLQQEEVLKGLDFFNPRHIFRGLTCLPQLYVNIGGLLGKFPMACCEVSAFKRFCESAQNQQAKLDALVAKNIEETASRFTGGRTCPADRVDKCCAIGDRGEVLVVGQGSATKGGQLRLAAAHSNLLSFLRTLSGCVVNFAKNIAQFDTGLPDSCCQLPLFQLICNQPSGSNQTTTAAPKGSSGPVAKRTKAKIASSTTTTSAPKVVVSTRKSEAYTTSHKPAAMRKAPSSSAPTAVAALTTAKPVTTTSPSAHSSTADDSRPAHFKQMKMEKHSQSSNNSSNSSSESSMSYTSN